VIRRRWRFSTWIGPTLQKNPHGVGNPWNRYGYADRHDHVKIWFSPNTAKASEFIGISPGQIKPSDIVLRPGQLHTRLAATDLGRMSFIVFGDTFIIHQQGLCFPLRTSNWGRRKRLFAGPHSGPCHELLLKEENCVSLLPEDCFSHLLSHFPCR